MTNLLTTSVTLRDSNDFEAMGEILTVYMDALNLQDIQPLPDYANIIFDAPKSSIEKLVNILQKENPSIYWQFMVSEGETILEIYNYDKNGLAVEHIGKTLEEIAAGDDYTCSHDDCSDCSSCSSCSSCHSHEHGEGCSCHECSSMDFNSTLEMVVDTVNSNDGEEFFSTLVNAYYEELSRFIHTQTPEDEADDAYDVFVNTLTQVMLAAAYADGSYTEKEHKCIETVMGEVDFDRIKSALPTITANGTTFAVQAMKYWHEAEGYDCDVRRLVIMICMYLCAVDAKPNEQESEFLTMIFKG